MKKEAIASGDQDKEDICFTRLRTSTLQLVCQKAKPVFRVKKHQLSRHFRLFDSRCETMFSICENCRSQAQPACNPSPYNNKWGILAHSVLSVLRRRARLSLIKMEVGTVCARPDSTMLWCTNRDVAGTRSRIPVTLLGLNASGHTSTCWPIRQ